MRELRWATGRADGAGLPMGEAPPGEPVARLPESERDPGRTGLLREAASGLAVDRVAASEPGLDEVAVAVEDEQARVECVGERSDRRPRFPSEGEEAEVPAVQLIAQVCRVQRLAGE